MKTAVCGVIAEACPFFLSLSNFLEEKGITTIHVEPEYSGGVWLIEKKINYYFSFDKKYSCSLPWEEKYDNFIRYNLKMIEIHYKNEKQINKYKIKLRKKAKRLLNFYYYFFQKNGIDVLLFWNGFQFNSAVAKIAANLLNIKCLYFEKSLIPYYLQIDRNGINYENSLKKLLRNTLPNDPLKPLEYFINLIQQTQPVYNPLVSISRSNKAKFFLKEARYKDFVVHLLNSINEKFLSYTSLKKIDVKRSLSCQNYIFFPLQVTDDTQLLYFGNQFISNTQTIKEISKVINEIDPSSEIIFKVHPFERNQKDIIEIYKTAAGLNNCFITDEPTHELIKNSKLVITVNSSVGFEAILFQKPVVLLGNSLYSDIGLAIKVNNITEIKSNYDEILSFKPDLSVIIRCANALESILVRCYFVNPSISELGAVWNFMKKLLYN